MENSKLNRGAIFSSGTKMYADPMEPDINDDVVLRCRTLKNDAEFVYLITDKEKIRMNKEYSVAMFDYYSTVVHLVTEAFPVTETVITMWKAGNTPISASRSNK